MKLATIKRAFDLSDVAEFAIVDGLYKELALEQPRTLT
jgi:hypothetical protein